MPLAILLFLAATACGSAANELELFNASFPPLTIDTCSADKEGGEFCAEDCDCESRYCDSLVQRCVDPAIVPDLPFVLPPIGACPSGITSALWLVIDGSGSVNAAEMDLQVNGYISGLNAIVPTHFNHVAIGASVFATGNALLYPLTPMTPTTLAALIGELVNLRDNRNSVLSPGGTNIAGAITFATNQYSGYESCNKTIDVSTDGNGGSAALTSATAAHATGFAVNCLLIPPATCAFVSGIGTVFSAASFNDVGNTLKRKLKSEIGTPQNPGDCHDNCSEEEKKCLEQCEDSDEDCQRKCEARRMTCHRECCPPAQAPDCRESCRKQEATCKSGCAAGDLACQLKCEERAQLCRRTCCQTKCREQEATCKRGCRPGDTQCQRKCEQQAQVCRRSCCNVTCRKHEATCKGQCPRDDKQCRLKCELKAKACHRGCCNTHCREQEGTCKRACQPGNRTCEKKCKLQAQSCSRGCCKTYCRERLAICKRGCNPGDKACQRKCEQQAKKCRLCAQVEIAQPQVQVAQPIIAIPTPLNSPVDKEIASNDIKPGNRLATDASNDAEIVSDFPSDGAEAGCHIGKLPCWAFWFAIGLSSVSLGVLLTCVYYRMRSARNDSTEARKDPVAHRMDPVELEEANPLEGIPYGTPKTEEGEEK